VTQTEAARDPAMKARSLLRQPLVVPLATVFLSVALASLARHHLVEPAELTAACDAAPWLNTPCALRTLTVQVFINHRLGGLALAAAVVALASGWRWLALLALAASSAGLMLYSTPLAAPALLLAVLALAGRRRSVGGAAIGSTKIGSTKT
jgi:hypothetical protein